MQDIEIIIRAWKDDDYRMSLSADEQQTLPENPAGLVDVSESVLNDAANRYLGSRFIAGPFC